MNGWTIGFYTLAIAGLALALASWSYGDWANRVAGGARPTSWPYRGGLLGLLLFCLGVAGTSEGWVPRGLWALLALVALAQLARGPGGAPPPEQQRLE